MTRSAWLRSQTPLSQPATVGRRSQVIDRWIHTACLCFGLDLDEQRRSGFGYAAVMEDAFDTIVDRTRTRLDVPRLRTLFGVAGRQPECTLVDVLSGSGRQPQ